MTCKKLEYKRESVLWTILPVGFKAAYWESVPAKSIFIHPVDYRTLGKAALAVSKPNEGHAGGCPACRAWKIVEPSDTYENLFSLPILPHFHF